MATAAQLNFVAKLETELQDLGVELPFDYNYRHVTSSRPCSHYIESLLELKKANRANSPRPQYCDGRPTATPDDVVAGIYYVVEGDKIFHVVQSKAGRFYAKRLVPGAEGSKRGTFEYEPGAIYTLKGSDALTPERMAQLGRYLGWCVQCGALLNDSKSVRCGMGPTCAKKHGVPYTDKARREAGLPL